MYINSCSQIYEFFKCKELGSALQNHVNDQQGNDPFCQADVTCRHMPQNSSAGSFSTDVKICFGFFIPYVLFAVTGE
jgi:hypothetical protein